MTYSPAGMGGTSVHGAEIRYAPSVGGIDIAYQVVGDGPVDVVFVSGFITHLELSWELPHFAWLKELDGVARVITFDKRGTGLSDRSLGFGSLEERADDIRAVMDAAGSERAFLIAVSEGGPISLLFTAMSPQRVRGLILYGTAARFERSEDYPYGHPAELTEGWLRYVEEHWGSGRVFELFVQNAPDPAAARRLIARYERNACTPKVAVEIMRRNLEIDVRPLLPAIKVPTLVVHATGDPIAPVGGGRHLAEHIPDARWLELPGDFHGSWRPEDVAGWRDAAVDFLVAAGAPSPSANRVLATVLFTDIISSTELASRVGDQGWQTLLDQHDRIVQSVLELFGGRLVKSTGDGVLATFDGPGRAIACARAMADALGPRGLRIRAGVHTGEIELRAGDVAGIGVVIARRVCDLADADEVLVSRTVKDLVTGSGTSFAPRGDQELKGVPGSWELFAVV